jgi:hypothetical protein
MPYAIGVVLALLVALFVSRTGFDRDRAVYPLILIMTVSYYVLFAVLGGSVRALTVESVVVLGFALVAVVGFAGNLWWVVAALLGHGAFDLVHDRLIANPGVPAWWPAFCLSFDVGFAAWLAALLIRKRLQPRRAGPNST